MASCAALFKNLEFVDPWLVLLSLCVWTQESFSLRCHAGQKRCESHRMGELEGEWKDMDGCLGVDYFPIHADLLHLEVTSNSYRLESYQQTVHGPELGT